MRETNESKARISERITVIASTKQNKLIQDVNGSVSVASAAMLRSSQIRDSIALGRVLPGLQLEKASNILYPTVSLRGASSAQDYYNPAVTLYVDGVPQLSVDTIQPLPDNLLRAEMLRGPQATLYGRSAEGGIVNIVTEQPGPKFAGNVSAGAASRWGYNASANVSGTLVKDWLYGSIGGMVVDDTGNQFNPSTGHHHLGGGKEYGGSAKLRLAPTGAPWSLTAAADGRCAESTGMAYIPFNRINSRRFDSVAGTPDPDVGRCLHKESLSFNYDLGRWEVSAVAAWQNVNMNNNFPYYSYLQREAEHWHDNIQEVRLATKGKGHLIDAVFGFYHQTMDQDRSTATDQYVPTFQSSPSTPSSSNSETVAGYMNATWHITHRLDLSGGARISHDMADMRLNSPYYGNVSASTSANDGLGEGSLGYRINSHWRPYIRVAQGYKPVGFNRAPISSDDSRPYKAEQSLNYEIGTTMHYSALSGRAALFYTDTHNMQLYSGQVGFQHLYNVGRTHAEGAEAEISWFFLPRWRVRADGTVVKSVFDKYNDGTGEGTKYVGNHVPFIPSYNVSAHIDGSLDLPIGTLKPGADVRITGQQYFDLANDLKQPTYVLLDLHATWAPTKRTELTIYANNVTDQIYRTYAFEGPMGGLAQINFGRTVGVDFHVRFGGNVL
ncbi:hypothetical protein AD954_13640 [Acetobacter cerevisiae]|uniref:TonB-dependent receptor n=1 Tax=Acetobacter cerevisiae TaxID=178900 RepID=A0A149V728_9PROT|nr:hypothetical protein AD954_13640 [Acetobacter cerevisiae]